MEDALKAARTLHRLIIGVSVTGLLFAFSLQPPDELRETLEAINTLERFDVGRYEDWVQDKTMTFAADKLSSIGESTEAWLDDYPWNGRDLITRRLSEPLHIGHVDPAHLSPPTLGALDSTLRELGGVPAQIVVLDVSSLHLLRTRLERFARELPQGAAHVRNVQIYFDMEPDLLADHFDEESLAGALGFELLVPSQSPVPVFQAPFTATATTVPNTSCNAFLSELQEIESIPFEAVSDGYSWFATLPVAREDLRMMSVDEARATMQDEIEALAPEERSLTLLTMEVPGQLAVLAMPVLAVVLLAYLVGHLAHLKMVAHGKHDELRMFAWLPLASTHQWWWIEPALTLIVLPVGTMLYMMLRQFLGFGDVGLLTVGVTVGCACWASILGVRAVWYFRELRRHLESTKG